MFINIAYQSCKVLLLAVPALLIVRAARRFRAETPRRRAIVALTITLLLLWVAASYVTAAAGYVGARVLPATQARLMFLTTLNYAAFGSSLVMLMGTLPRRRVWPLLAVTGAVFFAIDFFYLRSTVIYNIAILLCLVLVPAIPAVLIVRAVRRLRGESSKRPAIVASAVALMALWVVASFVTFAAISVELPVRYPTQGRVINLDALNYAAFGSGLVMLVGPAPRKRVWARVVVTGVVVLAMVLFWVMA